MLEEKKLKEIQSRVKKFLDEGTIKTKQPKEFVDFFLTNAKKSLRSANALYDLSTDKEMQEKTDYLDFDGFLWVVNACYYSMFYMTRALLESEGIKLKSESSIHSLTFDAVINFFYLNGKLKKRFIEDFAESLEEASEILGKQKADSLMEDYFFEKGKRAIFTYKTKEIVIKAKAKTSLERAIDIRREILLLIKQSKEVSIRKIESKVNTNFETIKRQIEDLESLGFVKIIQHDSHPKNKKPYRTCQITEQGIKWINKNK